MTGPYESSHVPRHTWQGLWQVCCMPGAPVKTETVQKLSSSVVMLRLPANLSYCSATACVGYGEACCMPAARSDFETVQVLAILLLGLPVIQYLHRHRLCGCGGSAACLPPQSDLNRAIIPIITNITKVTSHLTHSSATACVGCDGSAAACRPIRTRSCKYYW
jgi:hypothetical protein